MPPGMRAAGNEGFSAGRRPASRAPDPAPDAFPLDLILGGPGQHLGVNGGQQMAEAGDGILQLGTGGGYGDGGALLHGVVVQLPDGGDHGL
ncbi:MAG: hypothetical protein FD176_1347 [Rhodospirillaceae bacterium]|nr:MAG: hypothetical protein FD176_1347 [Rhodospirillaceae bacterium]